MPLLHQFLATTSSEPLTERQVVRAIAGAGDVRKVWRWWRGERIDIELYYVASRRLSELGRQLLGGGPHERTPRTFCKRFPWTFQAYLAERGHVGGDPLDDLREAVRFIRGRP